MAVVLKILGASLGILVPILLGAVIKNGIDNAPFAPERKASLRARLLGVMLAWTSTIWAGALLGVFAYHEGDSIPRFVIPLVLPVLGGIALLANETFRTILDHVSLRLLVGAQTFRLAGFALLLFVQAGILPEVFSSGGYGDLTTGSLALAASFALMRPDSVHARALFWSFSLSGLFDLANVAYLLIAFYPIWHQGTISSAPAAEFSLVMLPALAAPIALLLHVFALRNYMKARKLVCESRNQPLSATA